MSTSRTTPAILKTRRAQATLALRKLKGVEKHKQALLRQVAQAVRCAATLGLGAGLSHTDAAATALDSRYTVPAMAAPEALLLCASAEPKTPFGADDAMVWLTALCPGAHGQRNFRPVVGALLSRLTSERKLVRTGRGLYLPAPAKDK